MQIEEATQTQQTEDAQQLVSPFDEIKDMNYTAAVNILIQAGNAAQSAGALSVRDSVLLAASAEFLTSNKSSRKK